MFSKNILWRISYIDHSDFLKQGPIMHFFLNLTRQITRDGAKIKRADMHQPGQKLIKLIVENNLRVLMICLRR